jgi:hypothetical protein
LKKAFLNIEKALKAKYIVKIIPEKPRKIRKYAIYILGVSVNFSMPLNPIVVIMGVTINRIIKIAKRINPFLTKFIFMLIF